MGFIKLFNPAAHIWYLKGRPSYLPILLNFNRKQTESLIYCTESILNNIFPTSFSPRAYQFRFFSQKVGSRNIKALKRTFFLKLFSQPFYLPKISIESFTLQLVHFNFFPIKSYLETYESKKIYQSKKNLLKDINIDWESIYSL